MEKEGQKQERILFGQAGFGRFGNRPVGCISQ